MEVSPRAPARRSARTDYDCDSGQLGLHVVPDDSSVFAARRHRARVRIGQRNLLVFALHHLGIDRIGPRNLFLQFRDFVLEPRVGSLQLRKAARDALVRVARKGSWSRTTPLKGSLRGHTVHYTFLTRVRSNRFFQTSRHG
jgi:hypothetical protein